MKHNMDMQGFTQRLYFRLSFLLAVFHAGYLILFLVIGQIPLAVFNVGSVMLYLALVYFVKYNYLRESMICVHCEVCSFVTLSVLFLGWEFGFQFLLICIAAFCYFSPYRSKYTSYVLAGIEMVIFVLLYLHTRYFGPMYPVLLADIHITLIYLTNIFCTFGVIIYVTFISNVAEVMRSMDLKRRNYDLKHLSERDPLTELLNRRGMQRNLEQAYFEYKTVKSSFAVVIGDIDDFKAINDTYGHDCGDHVLKTLATILGSSVRGRDCVCRWGGEEFLLLLHNVDRDSTFEIIERVRGTIEKTSITYEKKTLGVTLTFGGYIIHDEKETIDDMVKKADEALYQGKHKGKRQTQIAL